MKTSWMILSVLPIAAFCQYEASDLFYTGDQGNEALLNIVFEDGDLEELEAYDSQGLSLLEIDEDDDLLIPWMTEELSSQDVSGFLKEEMSEEFDEIFAYDNSTEETQQYKPSLEKIPEGKHQIASRPRVIQSKPAQEIHEKPVMEKEEELAQDSSYQEKIARNSQED